MSKLTLILFLSAFVAITHAQKKNFTVTEYSTGEGLSQSVVCCVIKDSRGFIWAGTQDGLNRFDGKEFKVYKHNPLDSNSLSNSSVWQIVEDSDSNLSMLPQTASMKM